MNFRLLLSLLFLGFLSLNLFAQIKPKNVIVIGWDGADRRVVFQLIRTGHMPNLKRLIDNGSFSRIAIEQGRTETKPGWAQFWTGYNTKDIGVLDNKNYGPIPKGFTVQERAETYFKDKGGIYTLFLTGKRHNTGRQGVHTICMNCITRIPGTFRKSGWNDNAKNLPLIKGAKKRLEARREGEPFFHAAKVMDYYQSSVGYDHKDGRVKGTWQTIQKYLPKLKAAKRYLAFLHWSDPDEFGHEQGMNSKAYKRSLTQLDKHLGMLLKWLKKNNMNPYILVGTDHGMSGRGHKDSPLTWTVSNIKGFRELGDRRDIAPTVYTLLGMEPKSFKPALNGDSLFNPVPVLRPYPSKR